MIKKIFVILSINFLIYNTSESQVNIVTDRPDITESSLTVPGKSLQIEAGFSYSSNEYESEILESDTSYIVMQTSEYFVTPGLLLRYGLSNFAEFRFGAQLTTEKSESNNNQSSAKTNLEGVELALKFKLLKQKDLIPSTAVIVGSSIPALNPGSQTDVFDPSIVFCFSNELSENIGLSYNLGVNLDDGFTSSASGIYSLSLSSALSAKASVFAEVYGFIPFSENQATNYIDGGITFLIKKNLQLDFSGGYGLNSDNTEYFLSTGISIRIPN